MALFAGRILLQDEVLEGWLEADGGRAVAWGEGKPDGKPDARGWIVPAPVNAHTHVADACLRTRPGKPRTVHELVGPGGWKQRELARARPEEVAAGIQAYTDEMAAIGTAAVLDFREGGMAGVALLRGLADELGVPVRVFGRPREPGFDDAEAKELAAACDGIGLSALRDFADPGDVEAWSEAAHRAGKPFALHASEARPEPLGHILALDPAFLVHMTRATPREWGATADADVPVVVCPRSNAWYGIKTPVPAMLDAGLALAVGTDNGMLHDGNLWMELAQLQAWHPKLAVADLLRMATWNARRVAGLPAAWPPKKGASLDLVVLPETPWQPLGTGKPGFVVEGP
ncbi:MAG: hypothetical protein QOD77_895 [Thermoplasmata archaeon]|nr:hypothetical protein [Thermoplasmata archaeon]